MTFTLNKLLIVIAGLILGSVLLTSLIFFSWLKKDVSVPLDKNIVTIEKGSSLYALGKKLHQQELIQWPWVWVRYAQYSELTAIKAGEYRLPEKISPIELLKLFNKGEVIQYQITLVEGLNFKELLALIHKKSGIKNSLQGLSEIEIIQSLQIDLDNLEGWFYPDTYSWISGDSDTHILLQAYKKMLKVLDEEWQNRAQGLPYKNAYEALIMASIVEKETGAAFERELIAGVFVRRLQAGMRLATDPTVIYGMGEAYSGNLRRKDLKAATPFNTYVIKGLPPTPIASPGREAIHAALHPAAGSAIYFVAKGDGTHEFSDTLEAHNIAVKKYQLKRKSDYRSSPIQVN